MRLYSGDRKFSGRKIKLICASYFDVPFEANHFDAAVSVESLHHLTKNYSGKRENQIVLPVELW